VNHTAVVITVAYAIACVLGAAVAIGIWRSTLRRDAGEIEVGTWSRRETGWLVVVAVGLVALLLGTIFLVPYGKSAGPDKQVVRVTGVQFAWAIEPDEVRAGVPVEFLADSEDVSHGFGVYDDEHRLIFQAQVIPGRTQKIVHTFDEPGVYRVLCLEFCGLHHHEMKSTLRVTRG
jgi:cytochrome c oxidase subunit 2